MNGKGMAPKAGYNHAAYRENWDAIFNKSSTPYVNPMNKNNAFVTGHAAMHYDPCPPASGLLKIFGMRPARPTRPTVKPAAKPVKAKPIPKAGKPDKPRLSGKANKPQRRVSPKK